MGARYPYYLLADSREGQLKEAQVTRRAPSETPTYGKVRQGFVYERVPHITLRDIANNSEIDVIWETAQEEMETPEGGAQPRPGQNLGGVGDSHGMPMSPGLRRLPLSTPCGGSCVSPDRGR